LFLFFSVFGLVLLRYRFSPSLVHESLAEVTQLIRVDALDANGITNALALELAVDLIQFIGERLSEEASWSAAFHDAVLALELLVDFNEVQGDFGHVASIAYVRAFHACVVILVELLGALPCYSLPSRGLRLRKCIKAVNLLLFFFRLVLSLALWSFDLDGSVLVTVDQGTRLINNLFRHLKTGYFGYLERRKLAKDLNLVNFSHLLLNWLIDGFLVGFLVGFLDGQGVFVHLWVSDGLVFLLFVLF